MDGIRATIDFNLLAGRSTKTFAPLSFAQELSVIELKYSPALDEFVMAGVIKQLQQYFGWRVDKFSKYSNAVSMLFR